MTTNRASGYDSRYQFKFTDPDMMPALGRLAYNASYLEGIVQTLFIRLVSADKKVGERTVSGAGFQWSVEHARALVRYRFEGEMRDKATAWLSKAEQAYARRNRIVHSAWYIRVGRDGDELTIDHALRRTSVHKREFQDDMSGIDAEGLHAIAQELEQTGLEGVQYVSAALSLVGDADSAEQE